VCVRGFLFGVASREVDVKNYRSFKLPL